MIRFILAAAFAALMAGNVAATSDFYFYNIDGSPIYFDVVDTMVAVRIDPASGSNALALAFQSSCLADNENFEYLGNQTHLYRLESGFSLANAMAQLRLNGQVAMVNPVAHNDLGDLWKMNNRLIVIYKQTTTQTQRDSLQSAFGLDLEETIDDSLKVVVLACNQITPYDVTRIARDFFGSGLCLTVEPDVMSRGYAATNDPYYGHQWQFDNVGQDGGTADADVDWSESNLYSSPGLGTPIIALMDSGFELDHEDLPQGWCLWPYDAAGRFVADNVPDSGVSNPCTGIQPECWHGTAVLGVLKAATNNLKGLAGSEDDARVMPIKLTDDQGDLSIASVNRAFSWVRQDHDHFRAHVVSLSWSFPGFVSPSIDAYMKELYDTGVPIIVAAGNNGRVDYPATSPYVLAVGMTDNSDEVPPNSGFGPTLDLVAPGSDIWALDLMGNAGVSPTATAFTCDNNPNYMCHMSGTSFAAPLVAGIIAKILIVNPWALGLASPGQLTGEFFFDVLRQSADRGPYGGGSGRVNDHVGWGRVNADDAVLAFKHGDPDNSGQCTISDCVYLINFIFAGGPPPAPRALTGDTDCNGIITISDAVSIINYIFVSGPVPDVCPL